MKSRSISIVQVMFFCLLVMCSEARSQSNSPSAVTSEQGCRIILVIGPVNKPGRFECHRPVRLAELLKLAGGPTEYAGKTVQIIHLKPRGDCDVNSEVEPARSEDYTLAEVLEGNDGSNPSVKPGEVVVISSAAVIYVTGEVKSGQGMLMSRGRTLRRAVEIAGGPKEDTKRVRVKVFRLSSPGELSTEILRGHLRDRRSRDLVLQPYDIIEVSDGEGRFGHYKPLKNLHILTPELPLQIVR